MAKTLEMVFRSEGGKEVTISLPDPRDDLNLAQVHMVMQDIIDKKIFSTKSGELAQISDARIRSNDTAALA